LELQHVSVFHKTILRELLVPVKVTYCPLLYIYILYILYTITPRQDINYAKCG